MMLCKDSTIALYTVTMKTTPRNEAVNIKMTIWRDERTQITVEAQHVQECLQLGRRLPSKQVLEEVMFSI